MTYYAIASLILVVTGILNYKFHDINFVKYHMLKAQRKTEVLTDLRESINTMNSNSN